MLRAVTCQHKHTHRAYKPHLLPFPSPPLTGNGAGQLHSSTSAPAHGAMSSSAETEQEAGVTERWLQISLTGARCRKERGRGQCWQSCVHQWLPEILDCWLA